MSFKSSLLTKWSPLNIPEQSLMLCMNSFNPSIVFMPQPLQLGSAEQSHIRTGVLFFQFFKVLSYRKEAFFVCQKSRLVCCFRFHTTCFSYCFSPQHELAHRYPLSSFFSEHPWCQPVIHCSTSLLPSTWIGKVYIRIVDLQRFIFG